MSTSIAIGFSQDINIQNAAKEAAVQAQTQLQSKKADFALLLSTVHYPPHEILPIIHETIETPCLLGCSTAGIILSNSVETRGLAILLWQSTDIRLGISAVDQLNDQNIFHAGKTLAQNALKNFGKHGRQAFLFFSDSQLKNNSLLLEGIQEIFGNLFPIIGGNSCDDFHFKNTFHFFQDKVLTQSVTGLVLGGHINVGIGGQHGWRPLGKPRIITKSQGNVIQMIDGKKAFSLYEEYFGQEAQNLQLTYTNQMTILYPLGIFIEESNEYLLRNAVDILPDGSIVCQGNVTQGSVVHIMIGNKDSCRQAALQAANAAKKGLLGKPPKLIFIMESMARLKLLGRMAFQEIKKIRETFGSTVPIIGLYTDGEIHPFQSTQKIKKTYLQNESIIILAIA